MTDIEGKLDRPPKDAAVALNYDGRGAPRIVAKGEGALAEQIVAMAEKHQIPLQDDPELVALLAQVPLGNEIPQALFIAVAEVIAFAYLLSGKRPPGYEQR